MSIYVKDADGNRKKVAGIGLPGPVGKSAYQYAVDGGFTGTEEQFASLQAGMSNPNLLDNGYFAGPVNQREQTSYSERGYIIDRWILGFPADATASFTIHPGEYSEWSGLGGAQSPWLIHRFPDLALTGKMVTVSVLLYDGTLLSGSAVYNYVNDWNIIVHYFSIPGVMQAYAQSDETAGQWRVVLVNELTTSLKIVAVKLELGSVQTLAHKEGDIWVLNDPPPDKALELLKCQRYQWITPSGSIFWLYKCHDGVNRLAVSFPVTMRAVPSITYGINTAAAAEVNVEFITDSSASFWANGPVAGKIPSIFNIVCDANL